ncbi:MAG: uracil-DNA glycosylase [Paracoccaceae bacterium]
MESALDWHGVRALLEWQIELGVTEAIGDAPVNRFDLADKLPAAPKPAETAAGTEVLGKPVEVDAVAVARDAAKQADSLPALRAVMDGFAHCDLRNGARNLVFSDGKAGARVMIIGEAPGREEDRHGKPFMGQVGDLLDRMLAAIDLSRDENVYITNVLPWRPPQNRDPLPAEIEMMVPFMQRHVELAEPELIILMGNVSCQAVLGRRGINRLRGKWDQAWDKPVLPMVSPEEILNNSSLKRNAWVDLLSVRAKLND